MRNDSGRSASALIQVILLSLIVFLSPLIAGKLAPIPDLSIQALILLAALFCIVRSGKQGEIALPGRWILGSLIAFFGFLMLSSWHSASLYLTIRGLLSFGSYLLVFLMVAGLRTDRRSVYAILGSLVISSLAVGVLGVREYVLSGAGGWRVFSTFFNPDFLAGFAAMMLPVALAWYLSRTSIGISAVAGLTVLYMIGTTLITGSRFGALAAAVGVGVFLLLAAVSGSIGRAQVLRLLVIIVPMLIVHQTLSLPLSARVASTKAELHSGSFRLYTWKGTVRMAAANPIHGTGLGTFGIAYPRYALTGYTKLAHNTYLQVATEAGIPAAAVLILFLASASLPSAVALVRRRVEPDAEASGGSFPWIPDVGLIASGLVGGATASMVRNLVDSDWYVAGIGITFWAILGAAVALTGSSHTKRFSRTTGFTAGVIGGLCIVWVLMILAGEIAAQMGNAAWAASSPDSSMRLYQVAVRLEPLNAEFHRRIGAIWSMADEAYAQDEYRAAIRLEPGNAKNYYQLAQVESRCGLDRVAAQDYEKALQCNPNAVEVMLPLARMRHGDQAMKVWRRMVDVENSPYERVKAIPELVAPEYIFAHEALGRDLERKGDKAGAIREYRAALDRAVRYQKSVKDMKAILEANGRRDPDMERSVEGIRLDLTARLKASGGRTR